MRTAVKPVPAATEPAHEAPVDKDENRFLPAPQAELFRQVLSLYEGKEYTEGLDKVEQILRVKPDHGGGSVRSHLSPTCPSADEATCVAATESLCMKGLFLCCLDKKAPGYDLIEQGTEKDPASHIVWHVYAIALRADKKWEQALQCYKKACAIEKVSVERRSVSNEQRRTERKRNDRTRSIS